MWTTELAAEYLGLLMGSFGLGFALGLLVRSVYRTLEML